MLLTVLGCKPNRLEKHLAVLASPQFGPLKIRFKNF
jgi:hypothetical protein